jgi:hypothetical protein
MSNNNKQDDKTPSEFPEKWNKILKKMPEFKDNADASSTDDLKKIIVECEGNIYTEEQNKAADIKLTGAKEFVKQYSEPYREAIKFQMAKIQYALYLLDAKGVDLDNKD